MLLFRPWFRYRNIPVFDLTLFDIPVTSTVLEIKRQLVHHWGWLNKLIYELHFSGCILADQETMTHYRIEDQSVIELKIISIDKGLFLALLQSVDFLSISLFYVR